MGDKRLFRFIITVLMITQMAGCASKKNSAGGDEMPQIVVAAYEEWSGPSPAPAGGVERGTDLVITLEGWPGGQSADYVVFRQKKSFPATLERMDGGQVAIHARIVHESGILMNVSESVEVTDRLVFTRPDGGEDYLEINEWEWIE